MSDRLPAHLEAAGLIRRAQAAGGFAVVLHKGERDAGTILVVGLENGANPRLYERMPGLGSERPWTVTRSQDTENKKEFEDYLQKRCSQDPDLWLIELDVAAVARLIGSEPAGD